MTVTRVNGVRKGGKEGYDMRKTVRAAHAFRRQLLAASFYTPHTLHILARAAGDSVSHA